jgi:hypothetical protein
MRKLLLAATALTLCALVGCGRRPASTDSSATATAPAQEPAAGPASARRSVTQASAVSGEADGGAYGMPRAPIPYDQLGAYEQQQAQVGAVAAASSLPPGQAEPQPAQPATQATKPRNADTVFY